MPFSPSYVAGEPRVLLLEPIAGFGVRLTGKATDVIVEAFVQWAELLMCYTPLRSLKPCIANAEEFAGETIAFVESTLLKHMVEVLARLQ